MSANYDDGNGTTVTFNLENGSEYKFDTVNNVYLDVPTQLNISFDNIKNLYKSEEVRTLINSSPLGTKGLLGVTYFDPQKNKLCTENEYYIDESKYYKENGYLSEPRITGCMKWYTYKEENNNITMILEYNTHRYLPNNASDGKEIEEALDSLKNIWKVSPRLITIDEVATITGNTSWNKLEDFYLDSNNDIQTSFSEGASAFYWLFDWTFDCEQYGCNMRYNVVDNTNLGYWVSSKKNNLLSLWGITNKGFLSSRKQEGWGLRPVITISKSSI